MKIKIDWTLLTASLLLVLNSFIKKWFTTKSIADKSDLVNGHASKPEKIQEQCSKTLDNIALITPLKLLHASDLGLVIGTI